MGSKESLQLIFLLSFLLSSFILSIPQASEIHPYIQVELDYVTSLSAWTPGLYPNIQDPYSSYCPVQT